MRARASVILAGKRQQEPPFVILLRVFARMSPKQVIEKIVFLSFFGKGKA